MSMSEPNPAPGKRKPRRAEPIQPDRPGSGDAAVEPGEPAVPTPGVPDRGRDRAETADAERAAEQADTARENVRRGYGG